MLEAQLAALGSQPLANEDSIPAHDAHALEAQQTPLDDEQRLQAAEQSAARREHLAALQREFDQLASLSAEDASGWKHQREARAACTLQSAWRRSVVRVAFLRAVSISVSRNRENAAIIIQRALRTRRRIVDEAAPPISQATVAELTQTIAKQTLQMADELQGLVELREAWRAAAMTGTEGDAPKLPAWLDDPAWKQDLLTT